MADAKMSEMEADTTVGGTEKLLILDGTTSKTLTTAKMAEYSIDVLVAAAEATPTTGDDLLAVRAGAEKRLDLDAVGSYIVGAAFDSAAITTLASGDLLLAEQASGGARKVITAANLTTSILTGVQATVLNLSGLDAATLAASDLLAICQTTTAKKVTLANLEVKLWADFAVYVAALDPVATTAANDKFYCIQGGVAKYVTPAELLTYIKAEAGNVYGPAVTTTENNIPQWDSTENTLKGGLSIVTTVRTTDGGAVDTAVPTEQAVREMMEEGPDIDGLADIGAAIADADLVIVDDGANGTNRKSTFTRVWTWIVSKFVALGTKTVPVDADELLINDAGTLKRATVEDLWDERYALDAKLIQLDDFAAPSDNTDLNVSTGAHGLCPKLPGGTSTWLRGDGTWTAAPWAGTLSDIDLDGGTEIGADIADADLILVDDGAGGTNRKATFTRVWTWISSKLSAAASDTDPDDADIIPLIVSGTVKKMTLLVLLGEAWAYVTTQIQGLTGKTDPHVNDILTIQDSEATNALKELTISNLWTNALADLAKALKLEEFAAATDVTTGNSSVSAHGLCPKLGGGTSNFLRADGSWAAPGAAASTRWTTISGDSYTETPASTSTITFSDTTGLAVGLPLRYTYNSVTYYGIITAISGEGPYTVTIAGATLATGGGANDLTALAVGTPEMVCQVDFFVSGTYGDGTGDLLAADMNCYFKWQGPKAYLVAFSATQKTADSGTEPKINVKVNTAAVSTGDSNNGIQLSTAGTWVDNSAVAINTTNYDINRAEAIEINCTAAGGTGDAEDLTVSCLFVNE